MRMRRTATRIPRSTLVVNPKPSAISPDARGREAPEYTGLSLARLFISSFLVLFLEVALIRWVPAYVRLLAYFSNFILLASFLGIGIGCLLAPRRRNLFVWFPAVQLAVIVAVE